MLPLVWPYAHAHGYELVSYNASVLLRHALLLAKCIKLDGFAVSGFLLKVPSSSTCTGTPVANSGCACVHTACAATCFLTVTDMSQFCHYSHVLQFLLFLHAAVLVHRAARLSCRHL